MTTRLPERHQAIAELVSLPSVSSLAPGWDQSNRAVVDTLAGWLDGLGFRCEVLPVPATPGKVNLLASLGSGEGGLVLAGHTDTVPYDEGRWQQDPFEVREADNRLYGLGTCDMKGFLALAAEAAASFNADRFTAPLMLVATADEESTMAGARSLVEVGRPRPRFAVIGEPTDLRPVRAHKGIMMQKLRVLGKTGHSSDPAHGNSALEGMHRVLGAVLSFRHQLQSRYQDPSFAVPVPTLNLGAIRGGDSANRICGQCELDLDMRLLPGMDSDEVTQRLGQVARDALAGTGLTLEHDTSLVAVEPHSLAADSELVRAAEQLTQEAAGSVAFGTEAPFLSQLGAQTLVMGPGSIAQAHQPNEYVPLEHLDRTVQLLQTLIDRFCTG